MQRRSRSWILVGLAWFVLGAAHAAADETGDGVEIAAEDIALIPLTEMEWIGVTREHPELVRRLQVLGRRAERLGDQLRARQDRDDRGGRMLREQIERNGEALRPHLAALREVIRPLGVTDEVLAVLADAPTGPLRAERQAMRLVLRVPALDEPQQALLETLVPAMEGAVLALEASRKRLAGAGGGDAAAGLARARDFVAQDLRSVQKRYWRVVDVVLDTKQRLALRRMSPTKMTKTDDQLAHLYLLPGLTPSQGGRLKSLLVRIDAEGAPDRAVRARVRNQLAESNRTEAERRDLEREDREAERRTLDLLWSVHLEALEILTAEQLAELRAIPPMLTSQERSASIREDIQAMTLSAEQTEALAALRARYAGLGAELAATNRAIARKSEDYGPDSPQQDMMQMMRNENSYKLQAAQREALGVAFTEILTPEQVTQWVLGVTQAERSR